MINKGGKQKSYPNFFRVNMKDNYNMNVVVEKCHEFFVNVGSDLASKIPDPVMPEGWREHLNGT